jgi:hypothetical protein
MRSEPISVGQSIRSAMKKTAHTQEADMIIDLSTLDMEGHQGPIKQAGQKAVSKQPFDLMKDLKLWNSRDL